MRGGRFDVIAICPTFHPLEFIARLDFLMGDGDGSPRFEDEV